MRNTIEFCGISSLVGLLISAVAVLVALIWGADFAIKVSATCLVVCGAVFVAAIVATDSPLYKD